MSLAFAGLATFFGSSLRIALPFLVIIAISISYYFKSPFLGFFLVSIFCFQMFTPNKYYEQEILKTYEVKNILSFDSGRSVGFGLNLTTLFLIATFGSMISEVFNKNLNKIKFLKNLRSLKVIIFLFIGFVICGLGTSLIYSPFPALSAIWTVQYSFLYIVGIFVLYAFNHHRENFDLIYIALCMTLFMQFFISIMQFAYQSNAGFPIETVVDKQFYYGLDEINSIYRVAGTFLYPNELALILNIIVVLLIPVFEKTKKIIYLLGIFSAFIMLILTQSRTNWISFVFIIFFSLKYIFKNLQSLLKNTNIKKLIGYSLFATLLLSFLVLPRLILSLNFSNEGGGWTLRTKMIEEGFEVFITNPFFGFGAGTNEAVLSSYFPDGIISMFPLPILLAPLQLLLEFGVVGALFLLIPFYIVVRKVFIKLSGKELVQVELRNYAFSFLMGITVVTFHYLLQNHYGVVEFPYLGIILGSGLIAYQEKN